MTTISDFLQNKIPNYEFSDSQLQEFCETPSDVNLEPLELDDEAYPYPSDSEFLKRRDYAESCIYYAALNLLGGSSGSEKIGDVSYSGATISLSANDKTILRGKADALRKKHGFPIEEVAKVADGSGVYDGSKYVGLIR